ncbi:MAG: right-handed parallel beta-helix repeat-containing protein [Candidatus Thorarchaeota archaeon]
MKFKTAILLSFLLCISVLSTGIMMNNVHLVDFHNTGARLPSFTPHSTITITTDSDFSTQGWPGDGSPSTPYIIESLEIVSEGTCISISDTTAHFIIRNCTLSSPIAGVGTGIYLSNVNNGTVENCTISSLDIGINPTTSDDCTISNNTLANCSSRGIYVLSGDNCTIKENIVTNQSGYGVFLNGPKYSLVEHNNISNCKDMGLGMGGLLNITVNENRIVDSGRYGLYFSIAYNCTITNNTLENGGFGVGGNTLEMWNHTILDNTVNGKTVGFFNELNHTEIDGTLYGQIFLVDCFNVSINSGVFFNSSIGASLYSCTNCSINNTEISGNVYGIDLLESVNVTLTDNELSDCGVRFDGTWIQYWNITATGNTVNGKQFGYFLNQESLVINGDDYGQFVVVDSSNLSIVNGIYDSATIGVVLKSCFNCSISNAMVNNSYRDGIRVLNSANCTLNNVTCCNSREDGLYINESDNSSVIECEFLRNDNAMYVSSSDNPIIESNLIHDNRGYPIYLRDIVYGQVRNNSIHENGGSLRLYIVNWLEIINNTITGSPIDGVYMDFTSGVIVTDNKIYGNMGFGINVRSYALYSEIYNNMIGFNEGGNAADAGIFNEWDDGASVGNIWSDYSGSGTYAVGIGTDNYPLGFINWQDDVQYNVSASVPPVTWDIRLPNPDSYEIWWNGSISIQGTLNSSLDHITKSIEGLSVGNYNLTLVVFDSSGYSLVDTVIITVSEETTTTTTTTATTTTTTNTTTTTTQLDDTLILILGVVGGVCVIAVLIIVIKKK